MYGSPLSIGRHSGNNSIHLLTPFGSGVVCASGVVHAKYPMQWQSSINYAPFLPPPNRLSDLVNSIDLSTLQGENYLCTTNMEKERWGPISISIRTPARAPALKLSNLVSNDKTDVPVASVWPPFPFETSPFYPLLDSVPLRLPYQVSNIILILVRASAYFFKNWRTATKQRSALLA